MGGRTRIKVCGMREADEVAAVIAAGADAIGLIFAEKSPRRIEAELARAIVADLPPLVSAVGVFFDQPLAWVNEMARFCGLDAVQLHGEESPEYCAGVECRVIKVFRMRPGLSKTDLAAYDQVAAAFLFDTYHKEMAGGTGQAFAWELLAELAPGRPVILAGGLSPENVGAAIRAARPFAVDLNSGVELSPGYKNPARVREAVAQAAMADAGLRS